MLLWSSLMRRVAVQHVRAGLLAEELDQPRHARFVGSPPVLLLRLVALLLLLLLVLLLA